MVPTDSELARDQTGLAAHLTVKHAPARRPEALLRRNSMHEREQRRQGRVPLVLLLYNNVMVHCENVTPVGRKRPGRASDAGATGLRPAGSDRAAPLGAP